MQSHKQGQAIGREAFAALFEQYKNLVYKTAYLMLGDRQDAEEALQEVFVLVYKSLPGYDPRKGAFSTWLYRVCMNYCLNLRRKRRVETRPLDDAHPALLTGWMGGLAEMADREEVREAIAQLNEDQRAAVVLRYYFDLSYQEIAQILDVPLGTVKSRLDRSLRLMRRLLGEQNGAVTPGMASKEEVRNEML